MTRKELNLIGKKLSFNCGGEGGKPGPCPSGVGSVKPISVQHVKKVLRSVGGEMSEKYTSHSVIGTGSRISSGGFSADSMGFKVRKGLFGGVEVNWKAGGIYSERSAKRADTIATSVKKKLSESGYVIKDNPHAINFTVMDPVQS